MRPEQQMRPKWRPAVAQWVDREIPEHDSVVSIAIAG